MKKIILLNVIFVLLLIFPSIYAFNDCNTIKDKLPTGIELPSFIPFSNEVIKAEIGNDFLGILVIKNSKIDKLSCKEENNLTFTYILKIKDSKVIDNLLSEKFNVDMLKEYMSNGNLNVNGLTTPKKVKLFFTKIFLTIGSWFI